MPPEAVHVNDDVAAELLPELKGQLRHVNGRLDVLGVNVKDRRLDHFADVGAIHGRTRVARRRSETDLVVDDDVDSAAGRIAFQLREIQGLGHQSLSGECGVAVDQHGNALLAVYITERGLFHARAAFDDWIDSFQMARVWRQGQVQLKAARINAVAGKA